MKFNLKKWQVHLMDQSDCDSWFIPLTSKLISVLFLKKKYPAFPDAFCSILQGHGTD